MDETGPKIAIFGSRSWTDEGAIRNVISRMSKEVIIVTGGARGVDTIAENIALEYGHVVVVCKPPWAAVGKRAGLIRNDVIVDIADSGIAFWDGESRGTAYTMRKFGEAEKHLDVVRDA